MSSVEYLLYDLAVGMGGPLGALLGLDFEVEGIWHTGIVCYGFEWFYGSSGIRRVDNPGLCLPITPIKRETLGTTGIDLATLEDYLEELGRGPFTADKYDLFKHNCNTFSNEVAKFLCHGGGASLPSYILHLPDKFVNSPRFQPFKFLLDQLTAGSSRTGHPSSSGRLSTFKHVPLKNPVSVDVSSLWPPSVREEHLRETVARNGGPPDAAALFDAVPPNPAGEPARLIKECLGSWPKRDTAAILDFVLNDAMKSSDMSLVDARMEALSLLVRPGSGFLSIQNSPPEIVCYSLEIVANSFGFKECLETIDSATEDIVSSVNSILESPSGGETVSVRMQRAVSAIIANLALNLGKCNHVNPEATSLEQGLAFRILDGFAVLYLAKIKDEEALFNSVVALGTILLNWANSEVSDFAVALDLKDALTDLQRNYQHSAKLQEAIQDCFKTLQQ